MRRTARRLRLAASAPLLLAAGVAAATDVDPYWLEAIPVQYQGRWNTSAKACAPFTGRGRIEIAGRRLVVGGDPFEADYVATGEEADISVVSRYAGSAKLPWTRVDHFTLSADRKTLTDDHAGRKVVRIRCGAR